MRKRVSLYVDKNCPAMWTTALCLLAAVVIKTVVFIVTDGTGVFQHVVLPIIAVLHFILLAFFVGQEMLYKTAIPVWVLGICAAWQAHGAVQRPLYFVLLCAGLFLFCLLYTVVISGKMKPWLLLMPYAVAIYAVGCAHRSMLSAALPVNAVWVVLPGYLVLLGLSVMLLAYKTHSDGKYHPTWGDRADGRRIRSLSPIDQIGPYIMVNRTGANNLFAASVEITEAEKYVRRKCAEGMKGFGLMHVIVAAYVRTVAKYPALNRFVAGQKLYTHGDDISLSMTVKKEMKLSSPDTVITVHMDPHDTILDVYNKFNAEVQEAKNTPLESGVDNTAGLLSLVPGLVLKFIFWLLKTLDYFGQVPKFLLEISPCHGSAYITSMGSLGIQPVYHHLYDFGNIPVFCSFGKKRRAEEIKNGEIVERKYIDLKFNLDERICDGFYYAAVIKHFMWILKHPDVLDLPPETVEQDIP